MARAHYVIVHRDEVRAFRDPGGQELLGATIFCGPDPCLDRTRLPRVQLVRRAKLWPIDDVGHDPLRLSDDPAFLLDLDLSVMLVHGPDPVRQLAGAGVGTPQWAGWRLRAVASVDALARYLVGRPLVGRSPGEAW